MASLKALKIRIGSVKSTQKITKAMKMVAAAKLRRAQQNAESGRICLLEQRLHRGRNWRIPVRRLGSMRAAESPLQSEQLNRISADLNPLGFVN